MNAKNFFLVKGEKIQKPKKDMVVTFCASNKWYYGVLTEQKGHDYYVVKYPLKKHRIERKQETVHLKNLRRPYVSRSNVSGEICLGFIFIV